MTVVTDGASGTGTVAWPSRSCARNDSGTTRAGPSERDQLGQPDGGLFDYAGIVPW
ncbi:hypothetical protein [Nocardia sp. MH4]|uniref:hypothetical protein n=1 Tax=Nocardia sp. MH4 TaxID=1768677 RepID=UPI001C4FC277|nr:hypothetical protein [Nocardia sp. MH4]